MATPDPPTRQMQLFRQPPRSHLSQQPPGTQSFLWVPKCLVIAARNVSAWIGTHHPSMMWPITLPCPATSACLHPGFRADPRHHRLQTAECRRPPPASLPPGFQSPPPSLTVTVRLLVSRAVECPLRLRVDDAFSFTEKTTATGSMLGVCSVLGHADQEPAHEFSETSRHETLMVHLYTAFPLRFVPIEGTGGRRISCSS